MKRWAAALQLLALGWYIALSLLIPTLIGLWFDKKQSNPFPLFTIIGLGLGTIIMIYGVYRMIRQVQKAEEEQNKNTKNKINR